MSLNTLLLYTVIAFFHVTSPGPAVFLAIANGIRGDMSKVVSSSFGNILGLSILSTASILGLGAIVTASATIFLIVKITGALYLIYLGIKFIKSSKAIDINALAKQENRQKSKKDYFKEGFILAVTNPKPILFFTAIFPQFLNTKADILPQFIVMTLIFMFISFGSLCFYGFLAKKSQKLLSNSKRVAWFHKITGGIFIALGIGLLQLKRA